MNAELYKQIQELILMFFGLLFLLSLLIVFIVFLIQYYDNWLNNTQIKKLRRENQFLEERLKNITEFDRLRYEHEELIRRLKK